MSEIHPPPNTRRVILVGYHQSPASEHALGVATHLATEFAARLHVVQVVNHRDHVRESDPAELGQQWLQQVWAEFEHIKSALATWPGEWTYDTERGDPVRVLADIAQYDGAAMVVVGSNRNSRVGNELAGLLGTAHSAPDVWGMPGIPVFEVHCATRIDSVDPPR
jgi:nucleotide-binding universal stress UspA family protein